MPKTPPQSQPAGPRSDFRRLGDSLAEGLAPPIRSRKKGIFVTTHRRARRLGVRLLALLLASTAFTQQAVSAPGEIFETAAPVIGAEAPKSKDVKDGDNSVSTQTGALQYSYPVQVPAGRNGAAPSLALSYSSQSGVYGTIAAGWSLSIPMIQEDTSQGRLVTHSSYYEAQQQDPKADDRFTSTLAGGRPLVKVPEPVASDVYGAYRAQNDASFARYERLLPGQPARWRVRTTDGTTLYFGEAVRTVGCNNISEGYAPLTSSVDVVGNSVFYEWEAGTISTTTRECRIKQITWGMNANDFITTPFASVVFKWTPGKQCGTAEAGYIGAQFDYRSGTKVLSGASALGAIVVSSFPLNGGAVTHERTIDLGYSPSALECSSTHAPVRLLTSIQEHAFGVDAPLVYLPPVTFEYGDPSIRLGTQTTSAGPPPWADGTTRQANLGWGIRAPISANDKWPTVESLMVDIDGDGLIDRLANASGADGVCRANWFRNLGPSPGVSTRPNFSGASGLVLPRLRWRGSAGTIPNGGAAAPQTGDPYYESCALNGQSTAYRNVLYPSSVHCHDGNPATNPSNACQASTTPGMGSEVSAIVRVSMACNVLGGMPRSPGRIVRTSLTAGSTQTATASRTSSRPYTATSRRMTSSRATIRTSRSIPHRSALGQPARPTSTAARS